MDLYLVRLLFVSAHYCSAPPTFNIPLAATDLYQLSWWTFHVSLCYDMNSGGLTLKPLCTNMSYRLFRFYLVNKVFKIKIYPIGLI